MSVSTTPKRYDRALLMELGKMAAERLPPAAIMKAMFLYELNRDTEADSLFKGILFRLARNDNTSQGHQKELEGLSTRTARMENDIADTEHGFRELKSKQDSLMKAMEQLIDELRSLKAQDTQEQINTLHTGITMLALNINEQSQEIARLTDITRCLTAQQHVSPTVNDTPVSRLAIKNIDGRPLELVVPKGASLPTTPKENRSPAGPMTRPLLDFDKLGLKGLKWSMHAPAGFAERCELMITERDVNKLG